MRGLPPAHRRRQGELRRRFYVTACRFFFAAVALAIIQGCASTGPVGDNAAVAARPSKYFSLQGRISVRVGERLDAGKLSWRKLPQEENLKFFTPFGNQLAELVYIPGQPVTLQRDRETLTAASVSELTATLLGVPLDMDAIASWTQGIGLKENESVEKRFANGDAWQVTAEKFQLQGEYRFASRVTAIRADTVVRLVIDEWHAE